MTLDTAFRILFALALAGTAFFLHPFGLDGWLAAAVGLACGGLLIALEMRLRKAGIKRLLGAAAGAVLGISLAYLVSLVLGRAFPGGSASLSFLELALLAWLAYAGIALGASKSSSLNLSALGGLFGEEDKPRGSAKILDTSVIIDGRIADICEAGFMDGKLVIPQFVLRELQLVADSADSLKRNRGRRGLDILQRMQKMTRFTVEISERDFPAVREVDLKLIELAKEFDCKVVTNDFNLNKVAQLQGVEVLNINELANALKPIVLPGEAMRVFILKEGKEYNQGVAYLDDGTMVVVDNARKMISRTVDISVTSVLQTTAGKMIFGKFDDRQQGAAERAHGERPGARESAAGGGA